MVNFIISLGPHEHHVAWGCGLEWVKIVKRDSHRWIQTSTTGTRPMACRAGWTKALSPWRLTSQLNIAEWREAHIYFWCTVVGTECIHSLMLKHQCFEGLLCSFPANFGECSDSVALRHGFDVETSVHRFLQSTAMVVVETPKWKEPHWHGVTAV